VPLINRRTFLKGTVAGGVLAVAVTAGLLKPTQVLAAAWPAGAFEAKDLEAAVKALYGTTTVADSKAVTLKAPTQAENGTVVQIAVSSTLPGVESIAVLVKENPSPLAVTVALSGSAEGFFSARIKMGKTSDVKVVVKSQGKLYAATQQVKVTQGGC
jgi:sulfur-oxidizing protein SoxY